LDLFWFGLELDDAAAVAAITQGVQNYKSKYSFVWLDFTKFGSYLTQNMGCAAVQCGILVVNNIK